MEKKSSMRWCSDPCEVVLAAVRQHGPALEHASAGLRWDVTQKPTTSSVTSAWLLTLW